MKVYYYDLQSVPMYQGNAIEEIAKKMRFRIEAAGELEDVPVPGGGVILYIRSKMSESVWLDDGDTCYALAHRGRHDNDCDWVYTLIGKAGFPKFAELAPMTGFQN